MAGIKCRGFSGRAGGGEKESVVEVPGDGEGAPTTCRDVDVDNDVAGKKVERRQVDS
ncbi:uncharacterized protein VDAG_10389 [Verticillium dahliae VdLs.17]|uniref:Uncharacterized protein n=1 Tax=Verticillium dahliae (strain VdLs.17 / ATCC MYA-4575 / FGSC 10137) TaxID=498257 RepID=G2XJQ7_VERDV|nr:uncharacterized protein VDAG_10389 [Verticillium dahliae VdLs.17]EGY20760.1 hypothetical protein VDAG_10389 [Verticillium dahliae VdLs.17]KAH6708084.1 hypothetical protein EV126DRAFT_438460 [Verticillium dahliae]